MLPKGVRRFFRLGRAQDVVAEVDAELEFHFAEKIAALVAKGISPRDARAEAERQFGDLRASRQAILRSDRSASQSQRRRDWFSDWWLDVRHAVRSLVRTPGVTATIIVLIAAGVGANAAILGIVDRLLLRPPPHLVDPAGLAVVQITDHFPGFPAFTHTMGPYADIEDYARGVPVFSAVAGYAYPRRVALGPLGDRMVRRAIVTHRFFHVLGTPAALGRLIDSSDATGPPVAVISWDFWQRHFGGVASALGQDLQLDSVHYVVAGVMPEGFSGAEVNAADVWTMPEHGGLGLYGDWRHDRHTFSLVVIARRRPGATDAEAVGQIIRARPTALAERPHGTTEEVALASIIPGRRTDWDVAGVRLAIAVSVVSALLLLIAVANVANLLLVRAVMRIREFSIRAALGAGRARLMRLLITESVLLAAAGGIAAWGVGVGAGHILRAVLLPDYQWAIPTVGVLPGVFAAAIALVIGVVTGLIPGFLAGRSEALGTLRTGIQRGRGARSRVRAALIALQIAVSVLLCVGTGLFVRSLVRASHQDLGLALREMLLVNVDLKGNVSAQAAQADVLESDIRRLPGVVGVTSANLAPMYGLQSAKLSAEGADTTFNALVFHVAGDFLAVGGLRLLQGRPFGPADVRGAEPVAIVDSVFAARAWGGRRAVGRCFSFEPEHSCVRVIGVSASMSPEGLHGSTEPQFYTALAQDTADEGRSILVRVSGDPRAAVEPLWHLVQSRYPATKRRQVVSYAELLDPETRPWRVGVTLFSASALLALLLSSVGTYAVMAFAVRQRTSEFGIRRALGAPASHIIRLIVGEGALVAIIGVGVGLLAAVMASRWVVPLLYKVSPRDPIVMGLAGATLLIAALSAAFGAARIALRVNPREALQAD